MRLGELLENIGACHACISITGLCDEYREGVDSLREENWCKAARDRTVKRFHVIGFDAYSFEIRIEI